MTASDVPTSTDLPNNGFEGTRFLGYPIFDVGSHPHRSARRPAQPLISPYMAVYLLFTSPASFEKAGRVWAKVAMLSVE